MEKPAHSNSRIYHRTDEVTTKGMLLGVDAIEEWEEGGHLFRIDKIEPRLVGASMRRYELFCDGEPASGGRYHSTMEHAHERATFVAESSMSAQITYLWALVNKYRRVLDDYGLQPVE